MKKILLTLLLAVVCRTAHAAPINYIQSKSTGTQIGATIYLDTGTIRQFTCSTCSVTRALLDSTLSAGTSGYSLQSRGATLGPQWLPNASVGGSSGQLQYNNAGTLAGVTSNVNASSMTISTPTAVMGTQTNDNASVGFYGEYISSSVAGRAYPGTNTYGDMAAITLTTGDWDITGLALEDNNGATVTFTALDILTVSGNNSTGESVGVNAVQGPPSTSVYDTALTIPAYRASISGSTTYYLKVRAIFSVATPAFYGRISARRVR